MYNETKRFIIVFIVLLVISLFIVGSRILTYPSCPKIYIITEKEEYKVLNELGNGIDRTCYIVILVNKKYRNTIKMEVEQEEYDSMQIGEEMIREW